MLCARTLSPQSYFVALIKINNSATHDLVTRLLTDPTSGCSCIDRNGNGNQVQGMAADTSTTPHGWHSTGSSPVSSMGIKNSGNSTVRTLNKFSGR